MNENDHRGLPDSKEVQPAIQNEDGQPKIQSPPEEVQDKVSLIEVCMLSILISLELISIFTVLAG